MLKTIIYTMMLVPLVSQMAFSQSNDEKSVTQAVEALRKAMIDPDNNTLSGLAADDLSYGHSNGMIQDKTAFIEALTSGKSDFVTIELTEQTVKVVGNTAIVRHHFSATTNDGGKPGAVKLSILLIWQKQKGQWKLLARQAVKLP
jgi:ketosteroid isomerase-like protein